MQEVRYPDGALEREFFTGRHAKDLHDAMDKRLTEQQAQGAVLVKRTRIGRNATCPCGSGRKFKKCCIERSRLVGRPT
jgi:uncharacterized protein YecA (UPF0149 family)